MKKHLIAAAVAAAVAAPAFAQSNVEIYGVIDQGYTSTTQKNSGSEFDGTDKITTSGNGGAYTSQRLGFRGTEDLGAGLKAFFTYELGLNDSDTEGLTTVDTASGQSVRLAFAGISGSFGSIKAGRMQTLADQAWLTGDVGGGNNFIGRIYQTGYSSASGSGKALNPTGTGVTRLFNSRSDRLIEFVSPNVNGFNFSVQHGTRTNSDDIGGAKIGEDTFDKIKGTETHLAVRYANGPLTAMFAHSKDEVKLTSDVKDSVKKKQWVVGANYDLGNVKLFGTYTDGSVKSSDDDYFGIYTDSYNTSSGSNDVDGYELGVAIPLNAWTLQASIYDANSKVKGDDNPKTTNKGYQLAALYALSKRTTLYGVYGNVSSKAKESDGDDSKAKNTQYGFGIRHSF